MEKIGNGWDEIFEELEKSNVKLSQTLSEMEKEVTRVKRGDMREKEKVITEFQGDTDGTDEAVCPHCGYKYSDSWKMNDGEYDCSDCGRKFNVETKHIVTYSTSKR